MTMNCNEFHEAPEIFMHKINCTKLELLPAHTRLQTLLLTPLPWVHGEHLPDNNISIVCMCSVKTAYMKQSI